LTLTNCARVPQTEQNAEATISLRGQTVASAQADEVSDPAEARRMPVEESALARAAQSRAREAELRAEESAGFVQDGYGLFVGEGGERYLGEIHRGKRNGYGVDTFPNGD
jgi:hypothetical protein